MCRVLRCQDPVTHVINVTAGDPSVPRVEVGFCDEHFNRVEAGEPYHLQEQEGGLPAVLMGADLEVAGMRLVARITGTVEEVGTAVRGAVQLTGEYDDGTPLNLLMSNRALFDLRRLFERFPDLADLDQPGTG